MDSKIEAMVRDGGWDEMRWDGKWDGRWWDGKLTSHISSYIFQT